MANDSHYGLAAYVWSHDLGRTLRAARAIEAGWVQVNQGLGQSPGHSFTIIRRRQRQFSILARVLGEPNQPLQLFAWPQRN